MSKKSKSSASGQDDISNIFSNLSLGLKDSTINVDNLLVEEGMLYLTFTINNPYNNVTISCYEKYGEYTLYEINEF